MIITLFFYIPIVTKYLFQGYAVRLIPKMENEIYIPILRKCIGTTRMLDRTAELASSSPNTDFIINLGREKIIGRNKTFPNVSVKPAFVVGLGDTAFTGPVIDSSTIAYKIIASKSSSPIQLIY
jgi:hypothetical protein